ncbi:MAG: DUF2997 domain-containing protein [Gemmataceae bacterium]|nr:DUF2997 domain-containing protein [Gemmataceae bacterium]
MEEIEIEIDAAGKVTVRTLGIKGAACLDAVEALVKIVGREESKELTAEYYEQPVYGQTHLSQHLRTS